MYFTGENLGWLFNFRMGCVHATQLYYFEAKRPNLKLKTRPKQLLGYLTFLPVLLLYIGAGSVFGLHNILTYIAGFTVIVASLIALKKKS
jgi:hypothetical protein